MAYVLGIYLDHDLSACLLRDGEIVCHIEEERLTRVKHGIPASVRNLWSSFNHQFGYVPWASIRYCLDAEGIRLEDVDVIALPEGRKGRAVASLLPNRADARVFFSTDPVGGVHHYRHALSAFFGSPFDSAAVLITDGDGSLTDQGHESESGYSFASRDGRYREIFKNRYRPTELADGTSLNGGLGWAYEYVSTLLGFVNTQVEMAEPGKTMGLGP